MQGSPPWFMQIVQFLDHFKKCREPFGLVQRVCIGANAYYAATSQRNRL